MQKFRQRKLPAVYPPLVCPLTCSVVSEPPPVLVDSPDLQRPLTPDYDDAQTLSEWLNWKHTL